MKIIVAGCGKIGTAILSDLVAEGHDVTAMDEDPAVMEQISNIYDVMTLCGSCTDCDALKEAGIKDADLYVATTASDELNMLSCFLAGRMGAGHTVSRIRNPEYNDSSLSFIKEQLDLSMSLNPELLVAKDIFNVLKFPSVVKIERFSGRDFEMAEIRLPKDSVLDGLTVRDMREKYKANYLICAVQRGEQAFIPDGFFTLRSGDRIGITASTAELQKLLKMLGILKKQTRTVMILGGGKTTYYLAKMLEEAGIAVKIVERDPKRCQELSAMLPGAIIIQSDGTSQDVLQEEGLSDTDAFVALTGMDEENILVSISVYLQQVSKVITKVNRNELRAIGEGIGLECMVCPMEVTSNVILRYARALENSAGSNVEMLYKFMDGKAEALEFNVTGNLPFIGRPFKTLKLKRNVLIAGIVRNRKAIIPSGDDCIEKGDNVVVLSSEARLQDLSDILI